MRIHSKYKEYFHMCITLQGNRGSVVFLLETDGVVKHLL